MVVPSEVTSESISSANSVYSKCFFFFIKRNAKKYVKDELHFAYFVVVKTDFEQ